MTEQSQLGGKEMEPVTGHGKAEQLEVLAGATGNSERRKRQGRQAGLWDTGVQESRCGAVRFQEHKARVFQGFVWRLQGDDQLWGRR